MTLSSVHRRNPKKTHAFFKIYVLKVQDGWLIKKWLWEYVLDIVWYVYEQEYKDFGIATGACPPYESWGAVAAGD